MADCSLRRLRDRRHAHYGREAAEAGNFSSTDLKLSQKSRSRYSMAEQAEHDLEQNQENNRRFQEHQAPVAGDVGEQAERVLHTAQLELERLIAVDQIELRPQLL